MCLQKIFTSPLTKQLWVVTSIYFMMLGHGMFLGISNCMLPALLAPNSTIQVDMESASWLNASFGISSMIAYFISSALMASYGRRFATIIGLVPAIVSPLICYLAMDLKLLIFGRILGGVGLGAVGLVGVVVIGEYTTPLYRGVFLNLKSCTLIGGFTFAHILGNYCHWRTVMLTMMVPYSLNFLMAFAWPESPSWLATQKRYDECREAFHWLRGKSEKATHELNAMIEAQKELNNDDDKTFGTKVTLICMKFKKNNFLKPLGIYCFAAMLLEASGRHVFPVYAMQIIQQMDKNKSQQFFYTLCIDLIMACGGLSSLVLVKIMQRRTLLLSSGTASVAVLLTFSLYHYLQSKSLISEDWNVVSFALLASYFALINMGCIPVAFTLIGEMFPLEHRSLGSSIAAVLISIFMFVTLKITPIMLVTLKVYGTFTVYGIIMIVCLIVLYLTLPETKDRTLQEIEDYFNDKPIKDIIKNETILQHEDVEIKLLS